MNEPSETEPDIYSIDPYTWLNIPLPIIKAVDAILKTCISQNYQIRKLNKELLTLNSANQLHQKVLLDSSNKTIESQIQSLDDKLSVDSKIMQNKFKEDLNEIIKEQNEYKLKLQNLQKAQTSDIFALKDLLQSSRESIKAEVIAKYIKPEFEAMKLEMHEISKNLTALEKQMKYIAFKYEKSVDEINAKLENQSNDLAILGSQVKTTSKRFDFIVQQKTEDLSNTVKAHEKRIEDTYETFESHKDNYFNEIYKKEEKLKNFFDNKALQIEDQCNYTKNLIDDMVMSNTQLKEELIKLEETFQFESEKVRIGMEKCVLDCYKDAKDKLTHCYKEDINVIKQKLE